MTYFADLSEYSYMQTFMHPNTYNIGWLDRAHAFSVGDTTEEFKERLFEFCLTAICRTRGFHDCEVCEGTPDLEDTKVEHNGKLAYLGFAEIRVVSKDRIYPAPNLIYHYVLEHNYLPPEEFIEAVLKGPLPTSLEFRKAFEPHWYTAFVLRE